MGNYKFSVLIPVYFGDKPSFFNQAIESIYTHQNLKPNQIVIVVDGPVCDHINEIIKSWVDYFPEIFSVLRLKKNVGLGSALNKGLAACKYEYVARMDSDDISERDRFEKQIKIFEEEPSIAICGSNISEFSSSNTQINAIKKVPEKMHEIKTYAKFRNPINHPSVMFKATEIRKAGGYKSMNGFEDYFLWIRCLQKNLIFYNIQESLVLMRGGKEQLSRRTGFNYFKDEIKFFSSIRKSKFISYVEFFGIVSIRSFLRLVPKRMLSIVYKVLRVKI